MAATLSVLYLDPRDNMAERFGFKNEHDARACAQQYANDGYRNVVLRATVQDGHITTTLWTEAFSDNEDAPDDTNPWQAAINDLITYTIPALLLDVQRAALRGQVLTPDWIETTLVNLDRDLCAIA